MNVNAGFIVSDRWHLPVWPEMDLLYVLVEVSFAEEAIVAEIAALFEVYFLVSGELAALRCGVVTHCTPVRLLPGVGPPVDGQVGAVLEDLTTELAGVIPTPGYQLLPGLRVK